MLKYSTLWQKVHLLKFGVFPTDGMYVLSIKTYICFVYYAFRIKLKKNLIKIYLFTASFIPEWTHIQMLLINFYSMDI